MSASTSLPSDARGHNATASSQAPRSPSGYLWLIAFFGSLIFILGLNFLLTWRMDVFGMLRDPHGRELGSGPLERKAKYLLNYRYVPSNYNAIIVGSSTSVIWSTTALTGYRFYNESVGGGDATEERRVIQPTLKNAHFKVALIDMIPRITHSHGYAEGLDTVSRGEALGSVLSFGREYDILSDRFHHRTSIYLPGGTHSLPDIPVFENADKPMWLSSQDPVSVADYRALVQDLLNNGTKVIYVTSPLYGPHLAANQQMMADYLSAIPSTMPPAPIIDFNAPEYAAFRDDRSNFVDELHMNPKGEAAFSRELNKRMHEILKDQ